ncbi:MAG: ATPase, T2SS/T4P/T4SS family [Chloroflexia bacterium]
MPYNSPPDGSRPGFDPDFPYDDQRAHPAQNGSSDHHMPSGSGGAVDGHEQMNVFFPSGVDSDLESVLKPLLDASYSPPIPPPIPDNGSHVRAPRQPAPRPIPMPSTMPGVGPFPVGADDTTSTPEMPTPSGRLRSLQPLDVNSASSTAPLPVPGTVPMVVARPRATGPLGNSDLDGPLGGYGQTHLTGPMNSYTSPQTVHSLVSRILSGIPATALLERSPDIEQMLAGRFMSALSQIPGPVPANSQPILFKLVVDEILGWGPLEPLMQDPHVTEIMVNGAQQVWVERAGRMLQTDVKFLNEDHLMRTAGRMAAHMGRRLDRKWPMLDGRLPDGSRVNIIGPPCSLHGTSLTIRKLSGVPLTLDHLIDYNTITQELADFLRVCVLGRLNILVVGGSGTGKTTLLNALASFIPQDERIVTVEESVELKLDQRHVVALETRPPDYDTQSGSLAGSHAEITIRHLIANALRMRASRLLVGEIRGGETLDLISAMNTGHDGLLATMHAGTPRDAVSHLESMALMSGTNLPARSLREAIATAIDLIVQIARLRDGTRRVIYVTEVRGIEGDTIALKDIFRWDEVADEETGAADGCLEPTGHTPRFVYRLQDRGLKFDRSLFST